MSNKNRYLSNPCTWAAGGRDRDSYKSFTYEGGTTLYHFCPTSCGIFERHIPVNVVFFANDLKHAEDVLVRMLEYRIECVKKQGPYGGVDSAYWAKDILAGRAKWIITPAPTNQFFSVGWADNDTIL